MIYTPEYTVTNEYHNLLSSPPLGESQHTRWRTLSDYGHMFKPSITKSTNLRSPALRVIQALLNGTISGWNRCINNITITKFKYLMSMVDRTPYHLGYVITDSFHHQETNTRGHTIFIWPYITRLIKGMGLLADMDHLYTVGGYNPISLCSLLWQNQARHV